LWHTTKLTPRSRRFARCRQRAKRSQTVRERPTDAPAWSAPVVPTANVRQVRQGANLAAPSRPRPRRRRLRRLAAAAADLKHPWARVCKLWGPRRTEYAAVVGTSAAVGMCAAMAKKKGVCAPPLGSWMGVRTFRHQQCTWETAQTLHFSSSCEAPPTSNMRDRRRL